MTGNKKKKQTYKQSLSSQLLNKVGLSLRARFFLPSFIGIVLALILNLSYQSILASNQKTFQQLKENNLPQIGDISRISVSLVRNQNKLSRLLLSTVSDPDEERVYLEGREIYQSLYSLESSIKNSLETSTNEEQKYLFRINRIFLRYKHSVENALEISTVDTKLALEELAKSGDASQDLNDRFIELSDYHAKSLNIADTLLNNSLQDQTKINAFSIVLIVIMIILPILFFRKLTGNLDQINKALINLNRGEKNISLPKTNDSYIKNLADVVISFQKTLTAIVEARKKAEESSIAKSEFLAVMSHEIRTPMNGVLGMLNRIKKSDLTDEQTHFIKTAQISAGSLLKIINDILDFSKIDAGKLDIDPVDFDLTQLIKDITQVHENMAQDKPLKLIANINIPSNQFFNGDPVRTKQILDNLLSNAIKFTKQGSITLSVNLHEETPVQSNLIFSVQDTGNGIAKEHLKELFDPFTQADSSTTRQHSGTGLGLSIVQRLCHLMNGDIEVTSRINQGSTFVVTLPYKKVDTPSLVKNSFANDSRIQHEKIDRLPVKNPTTAPARKILVVEDNPINIEVLTFLLEDLDLNLTIATAEDGSQAIKALDASSIINPFNLVLMDCQMPVMDGYEATQKIRAGQAGNVYLNIPIIAITANAMKGDKEKCLLAGMTDFISKPIDADELEATVSKHLKI